jgi:4-amino-4-deoxy-L-arabinose transferase-like glycosyltransferase
MNDDSIVLVPASGGGLRRQRIWEGAGIFAVLVVAAALRLWRLEENGYGNFYYAAAVRSMLESWSNFFFGSFDPVGFITVDKPPVAMWIQAVSAALFGYSGLSLLLPQALMGTASVAVLYVLVRRSSGRAAALLAALILALTPISVAVDRGNLPDTALVLVLLLAAWALTRGVEMGRLGPLLVAMALVGLGFNIKMLAAFVVLPTFYLVYLVAAQGRWPQKLLHLSAATVVLVLVSLSWSIAVELTPPAQRPYVGGSKGNSALDLALGYNGLGRIFGGAGNFTPPRGGLKGMPWNGKQPGPIDPKAAQPQDAAAPDGPGAGFWPPPPGGPGGPFNPQFPPGPPGGPGPAAFGPPPGLLRFAAPQLAGQVTWFFPLALLGAVAAADGVRSRSDPAAVALLLWSGWLVTHWVVFSWAQGIFHEYYTTVMAPAVSALAGIGAVALWCAWFHGDGWRGYLLPATLLVTAAWQAFIVNHCTDVRPWLLPMLLGGIGTAVVILVIVRWRGAAPRWGQFGASVGCAALLLGPAWWSGSCVVRPAFGMMPAAWPGSAPNPFPIPPPFALQPSASTPLVEFLRANRHGERFLVAGFASMSVAPLIIGSGEPAVALGGFMGADPALSREEFVRLVEEGQLRFVILGGPGPGGPFGPGFKGALPPGLPKLPPGMPPGGPMSEANLQIMEWVQEHGKEIDPSLWKRAAERAGFPPPPGRPERLYDCKPELGLVRREEKT